MVKAKPSKQDVRIAEMRHRFANSVQLMTSLGRQRLRSISDPECRRHLSWMIDLVATLGLLEYKVSSPENVSFGSYLKEAADIWDRVGDEAQIQISVEVENDITLHRSASVALAEITHELITNSIEHGFSGEEAGHIAVHFKTDEQSAELFVVDNGRGLDAAEEQAGIICQQGSNGLPLIRQLSQQLGGEFDIYSGALSGTVAHVTIPLH